MSLDAALPPAEESPFRWYYAALALLVVVGLVACVCGGGWLYLRNRKASPDNAQLHDCLAEDRGSTPPFRRVSCDDGAARYRVLEVADWMAFGPNPCVDVAGARRMFDTTDNKKIVCIGDKDADPTKSANIARDGDCLRVVRDADAQRLPCSDPTTNFKVLRRLTDVFVSNLGPVPGGAPEGPCVDVPDTATQYAYQWRSEDESPKVAMPALGKHYDLLFCLARVHEPPPAVKNAKPNCRFISAEAVLAAVNAAGGDHHSHAAPVQTTGNGPCDYTLFRDAGGHDGIIVELTGNFDWPPPDHQEFTIDGVKAAWRSGATLPVGYLVVARPGGNFKLILTFTSAANLREAAVRVYRAAAPHLP
jgi:hypothetical protein